MDTRETIIAVTALIAGAVVLVAPAACTMNRHRYVAEAIKAGADPLAVKCAIEGDAEHTEMCRTLANQRRQEK